jgi:hypothetical protein
MTRQFYPKEESPVLVIDAMEAGGPSGPFYLTEKMISWKNLFR